MHNLTARARETITRLNGVILNYREPISQVEPAIFGRTFAAGFPVLG